MTTKSHPLDDAPVGAAVGSPEFTNIFGTAPTYVQHSDGKKAINAQAADGTASYAYDTGFNSKLLSVAAIGRIIAVGSANGEVVVPRFSSTKAGSVLLTTARTFQMRSGTDAAAFTTAAIPFDTDFIFRGCWDAGSTTTNGRLWGEFLQMDDTTAYGTGSANAVDNKQTAYTRGDWGKVTTTANGLIIQWKGIKVVDGIFANGTDAPKIHPAYLPTSGSAQDFVRQIRFTGSGVASVELASQLSGPTVAVSIDGPAAASFVDSTARTANVVLRFTLTGKFGDIRTEDVTVTPAGANDGYEEVIWVASSSTWEG